MYIKEDLLNNPTNKFKTDEMPFDLDFTVVSAKTSIPSKGSYYPSNKCLIRGLRYKEQMEVTDISKNSDRDIAFFHLKSIYKNCIHIDGVDFNDILSEDFMILATWISYLTNPDQKFKPIIYKCPNCKKDNKFNVNLFTGDFSYEDFKINEPTSVETSVGKLLLSPVTIGEVEAFNMLELDYKSNNALFIKKLNGKDVNINERLEIFWNFNNNDIMKVSEIISGMTSSIKPLERKCSNCGNDVSVSISIDLLKETP